MPMPRPITFLFWSKRGDVACAAHAPDVADPRWKAEQWKPLRIARPNHLYQCQYCHRSPVAHSRSLGIVDSAQQEKASPSDVLPFYRRRE